MLSWTDFKYKYAGLLLGYMWSVMKPLLYFSVLWVVFHSIFRSRVHDFALYLTNRYGVLSAELKLWAMTRDWLRAVAPGSGASLARPAAKLRDGRLGQLLAPERPDSFEEHRYAWIKCPG